MSKNRDHFSEAYHQYYTLVFNAVYLKVNDLDDTEDICQEVFIRFYRKMNEVENVRQWLYGTLKLVVMEYYRKRTSTNVNIDDVFNDLALTFVNGMKETRMIISDTLEQLQNILSDDERVVFDLIAFYNYTYKETAKQTGMTMRMVEYRYTRTVARILDFLKIKGIKDLEELL